MSYAVTFLPELYTQFINYPETGSIDPSNKTSHSGDADRYRHDHELSGISGRAPEDLTSRYFRHCDPGEQWKSQ